MRATVMILLAGLAAPGLAQAVNCDLARMQQPLRPTILAPVAPELAKVYNPLGAPGGVLAEAFDESQSVDQVLLRIHAESCSSMANVTPAPGVINPDDPAAYKPRTEFDNAPWRFNMSQNGKKMTADEFSAWMKSRGVRVARGRAPAAAPDVAAPDIAAPDGAMPEAPGTEGEAAPAPAMTASPAPALPAAAPAPAEAAPAETTEEATAEPTPTEQVAPAQPR